MSQRRGTSELPARHPNVLARLGAERFHHLDDIDPLGRRLAGTCMIAPLRRERVTVVHQGDTTTMTAFRLVVAHSESRGNPRTT